MNLLIVTGVLTHFSHWISPYLRGDDANCSEEPAIPQIRWPQVFSATFQTCLRVEMASEMCQLQMPASLFPCCVALFRYKTTFFLLKARESAESVHWLIVLFRLIKWERSAALKAPWRHEPWKQVTSKWGGVRQMTGTVTPLKAEVQLFNNVFLNAKFSTVYCGLSISPDTRLIFARPKELIYTSS